MTSGNTWQPGRVALFGSGETSLSGGRVFEALACKIPPPLQVAVLETPAGFEPNSAQVAGRVAEFISLRLQNYRPHIDLIPARKKGTLFSPDNPDMARPILRSNLIFLGPGSPTYAVRQLEDSLVWHALLARHRLGATIVMASAATIAASAKALPVYEIYKVGEDPHWHFGLNFFEPYGLSLVFIPHWNNNEGGVDLDTRRCFMGQERFEQLLTFLPLHLTVIGIDEHTALIFDLEAASCQVIGVGGVTILKGKNEQKLGSGETCPVHELGPFQLPASPAGILPATWEEAWVIQEENALQQPSAQVMALVERRQAARARRDWAAADELREQVEALGWSIKDTSQGPLLEPLSSPQKLE